MVDENILHTALENITSSIVRSYVKAMDEFIASNNMKTSEKSLTNADVIVMILNVTVSSATAIYYSLKDYLHDETLDYDFMRAKLINELSSEMDKIKTYDPKSKMLQLTVDQIKTFIENGYVDVELKNGVIKRVTKDDILIDKNEADKYLHELKKTIEEKERASAPKIIQ